MSENIESRQKKIAGMFSRISGKYDILNTIFTLGIDSIWRRRAVEIVLERNPLKVLDVASGTGKMAFEARRQNPSVQIFCLDPSMRMIELARMHCSEEMKSSMNFVSATGESMPFKKASFDALMVAFGIRNFADLEMGLKEMFRVLKPGGVAVILEFSMPDNFILRFFYNLYLGYAIPLIGLIFSKSRAYFYLRDTIKKFPRDEELKGVLQKIGFTNVTYHKYTTGVVACYKGVKPED